MKRFTLFLTALVLACFTLSANNTKPAAGLFQDNLTRFEQEFDQLNQLEQTVDQTGQTYSQLAAENSPLLENVAQNNDISNALLGTAGDGDRLLGIPGFFWGFCLGILGIILVYVAIEDSAAKKREGKQAIIGCAIWSVLWLVLYFGLWAASPWF
jgi:hypothetical protein